VRELRALQELISELEKLPSIGRKSAQRIAFHLLKQPVKDVERLAHSIRQLKEKIVSCPNCFYISEQGLCEICNDSDREHVICVVQEIGDVMAIERVGEFKGKYHVLNGVISPLDGIGPEDLKIKELIARIDNESIKELIIATNFTVEGEATAMYLTRLLKPRKVKLFRLAYGLPVGSNLEHADEATMLKALEGKREL